MYARPDALSLEELEPRRAPLWHRAIAFVLKAAVALGLLAGGGLLAWSIYGAAPVAERRVTEREARLVEVARVETAARGPVLMAWGVVEPDRILSLRPEIGGRVVAVAPELTEGGRVEAGAVLVRIDDRNVALDLAEAEAEIARMDAQIRLEMGQQARAERDLARSPVRSGLTDEQRALILREPQMAELQAQRAVAVARRQMAALDLARTEIRAPFDAIVESESVAVGSVLSAGVEIASLVATGRFRVSLTVPPITLDRIKPEPGRAVTLDQPGVWPEGAERRGTVVGLDPGLTETGRMAELIVAVEAPLDPAPGRPPLFLGAFLAAEIEAPQIPGASVIARAWLRDDDTVWIMGSDDRLEIRRPQVLWRGAETVLVGEGLVPGERVVTTLLATVADGMALRVREATPVPAAPEPALPDAAASEPKP
ncbi:MAG: efflux RND transporter periplasmic adaptor subunit [Pseudomonadota bacterium]